MATFLPEESDASRNERIKVVANVVGQSGHEKVNDMRLRWHGAQVTGTHKIRNQVDKGIDRKRQKTVFTAVLVEQFEPLDQRCEFRATGKQGGTDGR